MTTLEQPYKFVQLQHYTEIPSVNGDNIPFFLASDNSPLNKFYQPITSPVTVLANDKPELTDPYTKDRFLSIFCPQDFPQIVFPNPNNFTSKEQYESALLTWFRQANRYLASVALPTPITSCFYVPSAPKIFTQEEKTNLLRYKTFKPNVWQLLPKNYLHMVDLLLSNEEIYPNIPFPEQIPKREPILYLHHITREPQWMGQMIPVEPKPFIYDNVNDYEKAYVNWSIITCDQLKKPPIPPSQFGEIASLQCYYNSKEETAGKSIDKPSIKRKIKKKNKFPMKIIKKTKSLIDLDWAKNKNIVSKEMISSNLQNLFHVMIKPKKNITNLEPVVEVFGIKDKSAFVQEMVEYGYQSETLISSRPIHPIYFLFGTPATTLNYFEHLLYNPNNYTLPVFLKILDSDFTRDQFDTLLSNTVSNNINHGQVVVANLVDSFLNDQQKVMYLLAYSKRSLKHSICLSFLFRSLFNISTSYELFYTIIKPSNIVLFYHIISKIAITSHRRITITPMITNFKNTPLMKINHLYLIQSFLILFNENDNPEFYQKILEKSKSFFMDVYHLLAQQETFLNTLRDAPIDTDEYKALLMLIQCESPSIHQLVLGEKFLLWINKGNTRPVLLWTIAHSTSMMTAAYFFLKNCSSFAKYYGIDGIKSSTCLFISSVCRYIHDYAEPLKIRFNGKNLIQFFQYVLQSKQTKVFWMIEPISLVLSSFNLVSNFSSWEYRQLLGDTISTICKSIVQTSHAYYIYSNHNSKEEITNVTIYIIRMKALLNFIAYYNSIFPVILQINNFIEEIVNFLNVTNEKVLRITWKFFKKFTQDLSVLEGVLKKAKVQQILTTIFNKENKVAQRKMFKFCANVWRNTDPKSQISKKCLCDIINPVITNIINNYTIRFTIYKDELIIKKRIEDFFSSIELLVMIPVCQEFAQNAIRRVHNDVSTLKSQVNFK